MKHLKSFNEINESIRDEMTGKLTEKYPKRELDKPTEPAEPFKRKLTDKELDFLGKFFKTHSWSLSIDAEGRIILGGGTEGGGKYYITEEDISNFMEEEKMEEAGE